MIADLLDDLDKIIDACRWAHGFAYGKTGRGLDAERGADLSRTQTEKDKGPTYDIEIGNHQARVAYQQACTVLNDTTRRLIFAAGVDGLRQGPVFQLVTPYSVPLELINARNRIVWYLERIHVETHKRTLDHIRKQFDMAVRDLTAALSAGEAQGIAHGEKPCKTCGIRPQAEREKPDGTKRPAAAGECDTCATWRRRNGSTRPKELDTGPVNEARAAQARRMARGEGWGAA